jgi:hypothetical protein
MSAGTTETTSNHFWPPLARMRVCSFRDVRLFRDDRTDEISRQMPPFAKESDARFRGVGRQWDDGVRRLRQGPFEEHTGYPQAAGLDLMVAGVRTNFRIPDVFSVGISGGSLVDAESGSDGPGSVGFRLTEPAPVPWLRSVRPLFSRPEYYV